MELLPRTKSQRARRRLKMNWVLAGPSASVYNISISDANDEAKEMAKKTGPDQV